ncbi:MAG: hypothetical protein ACRDD8_08495 [Bacteroidales bacterium]
MNTFPSIDVLVGTLNREKVLLKEMFSKRKALSFRQDYALELLEYKESRIQYLIDNGIIRDNGDFLELEDVYLKFFEDVLEVNEEINISFVQDFIDRLNENIDYYLKENNENRRYNYYREVKRCLKNIALATVRNVVDLKRNLDITYKTEPNYQIKKAKLHRLDEKRNNIVLLIRKSEELINSKQTTFFRVAMDVQMQNVVMDVKLQLNDSYHNLIEVEKQVIHYLNLIDYQNRILEKVRKLKFLKDQYILEENTDIRERLSQKNPLWMEPQTNYRIKLSVNNMRESDDALAAILRVSYKNKTRKMDKANVASPIPDTFLADQSKVTQEVNLREIYNSFMASGYHLFYFVMHFAYRKEVTLEEKLVYFCQLVSLYADQLRITDQYECFEHIEYPLVYAK